MSAYKAGDLSKMLTSGTPTSSSSIKKKNKHSKSASNKKSGQSEDAMNTPQQSDVAVTASSTGKNKKQNINVAKQSLVFGSGKKLPSANTKSSPVKTEVKKHQNEDTKKQMDESLTNSNEKQKRKRNKKSKGLFKRLHDKKSQKNKAETPSKGQKAKLSDSISSVDSGVEKEVPSKGKKRKLDEKPMQPSKSDFKKFRDLKNLNTSSKDSDVSSNDSDDSSSEESSDLEQSDVKLQQSFDDEEDEEDSDSDGTSSDDDDADVGNDVDGDKVKSVKNNSIVDSDDDDDDSGEENEDDSESGSSDLELADDKETSIDSGMKDLDDSDNCSNDDDDEEDDEEDIVSDEEDDSGNEQNVTVRNDEGFSPPEGMVHESLTQKGKKSNKRKVKDDSDEDEPSAKKKKADKEVTRPRRDKQAKLTDDRTIFVGNVPLESKKKDMKNIFAGFGEIESVRFRCLPVNDPNKPKKVIAVKKDFHPGRKNCVGFVRFKSAEAAKAALATNGKEVKGFHIRVDMAARDQQRDTKQSVFIGNLPFDIEEESVFKHFNDCGDIESVRLIRDQKTCVGKGFGFVNFKDPDGATFALKLNESKLCGRKIRIQECSGQFQLKSANRGEKTIPKKLKKKKTSDNEAKKGNKKLKKEKKTKSKITPSNVGKNPFKAAMKDSSKPQKKKLENSPNSAKSNPLEKDIKKLVNNSKSALNKSGNQDDQGGDKTNFNKNKKFNQGERKDIKSNSLGPNKFSGQGPHSNGKKFGDKGNFAGKKFEDKGNFAGKKFGDKGNFAGKKFGDKGNFAGKKFGDKGNFAGKKFGDKGNFAGKKFEDKGNFAGKKFEDKGNFAGKKFGDKGNFAGKKFGDKGNFAGNKFGDKGNFAGNKFGDKGNFAGKKFGDKGNFAGKKDFNRSPKPGGNKSFDKPSGFSPAGGFSPSKSKHVKFN